MKIGILTHYNVSSHGALLQMYALKQVLQEMGNDVAILTYTKNMDFINDKERKRFSASIENFLFYINNYLIKNGIKQTYYQFTKKRILDKFRRNNFTYIPYTDSCDCDYVVVGSDEVFSLENGVNFMMYGHGITSKHLISYAPSFGQTDIMRITKYGCRALITSGLSSFCTLSVRDEGSKNIINELIGKDIPIVCDPTLLYDFSKEIIIKSSREQYIVVYSYQSNFKDLERIEAIITFARKKHCKLYSLGTHYKWCDKKINCDPLDMLRIFSRASFIITDTFHGTIMSVITETPMAVFVRENNSVKMEHLLDMLGLSDRKIYQSNLLEHIACEEVDFTTVQNRIKKCRDESIIYLSNALDAR